MKKFLFIIALFAALIPARAADFGLKDLLLDPWFLTVENNEKIYVVRNVYEDSVFVIVTQDDTLFFKEDPQLYCRQAFIMNQETGEYQRLHRNNTVVRIIIWGFAIITLILLLLQIAIYLVRKP
jgi:hypothetical protein